MPLNASSSNNFEQLALNELMFLAAAAAKLFYYQTIQLW